MSRISEQRFSDLAKPAFEMVARQGLDTLTLRPLAQNAGMSLSSMANRIGHKSQLIRQLIGEAQQIDAAMKQPVLAGAGASLTAAELAEICDLALEHQQSAPWLAVFFGEIIQASASDGDAAEALTPWLADQLAFWQALVQKLATGETGLDAELLAKALLGYSIDETAHGCALNGLPAYRRLRRLCLGRLCQGRFTSPQSHRHGALFQLLVEELGRIDDPIAIIKPSKVAIDRKADRYAAAAGHILVHQGAGAVTHRSVAALAGVAASTLSYHFKTREDLISGAMARIIQRLRAGISGAPDEFAVGGVNPPGYEIARSTFTLALEASRRPVFLASAADMRRRRGENLLPFVNQRLALDQRIDALGAQTLAVVSIGTMVEHSRKGADAAAAASQAMLNELLGHSLFTEMSRSGR